MAINFTTKMDLHIGEAYAKPTRHKKTWKGKTYGSMRGYMFLNYTLLAALMSIAAIIIKEIA